MAIGRRVDTVDDLPDFRLCGQATGDGQGSVGEAKPILLSVIAPQDEKRSKGQSEMNSNYFFSRGLFEKIKEQC